MGEKNQGINLDDKYLEAYDRACRYLGLKQRTEYEIKNYLKNKNYDDNLIVKVISELKEEKFIDDKKYAGDYIVQVLPHRPMGKILARQKLLRRGIKREIIEEVFENEFTNDLEKELAKKLAAKKIKIISHSTNQEQYEKLARYLNSRGFPAGVIAEVLKEIIY